MKIEQDKICEDCGQKLKKETGYWAEQGIEYAHLCPYKYMGTKSYGKKPRW